MRLPGTPQLALAAAALLLSAGSASAQQYQGTPVDRNVGDTGPNAASQRIMQPGIGRFGTGSLLTDRNALDPFQPTRHSLYSDPRTRQRYMLQSPGYTALISRPDYIGPSPQGGWAFNQQTFDGYEILTLTPANTVFVLSPEMLQRQSQPKHLDMFADSPYLAPLKPLVETQAYMNAMQVNYHRGLRTLASVTPRHQEPAQVSHYRDPALVERERKKFAKREAELAKQKAEQAKKAEQAADQDKD